ncbi:TPA: methionine adenosyltransferase [bacterium]|nr:methionine adenosyltransferase [bacterium]
MEDFLFTSESVTEGHPDKIADQISDGVLDAIIKEDPNGRVACECLITTGLAFVAGEITTSCYVNITQVVRDIVRDVGYIDPEYGFDYESCAVITAIQEQSSDIAQGVDIGGAGDQGMMFGYATNETPELMPMPILLAHKLTKRLSYVRKHKILDWVRPDGKSQVTVEYIDGKPKRVRTVIIACQHDPEIECSELRDAVMDEVIKKIIPESMLDKETKFFINPTGRFVIGGPQGDTGLTGRKIIVDTYGGWGRHGGGCFSGKDPTKVDRSASYMARYLAKNIVAGEVTESCEVQLAYAIGVSEPIAIMVTTKGKSKKSNEELVEIIKRNFDLSPKGIIDFLDLRRPIFRKTAVYGHFGREEPEFSWEKVDKKELFM